MQVRLLGPVQLRDGGGPMPIGPRVRVVLAALLCRALAGAGLPARDVIVTTPPGYMLSAGCDEVDVLQIDRGLAEALGHWCGRALEVYRDARRSLIEELGLEPGPELRRMQQEILGADAAARRWQARSRREAFCEPSPLPSDAPHFAAGSAADLAGAAVADAEELMEELIDARLLDVTGRDSIGRARYRFHGLFRVHACERVAAQESPAERRAALSRALATRSAPAGAAFHRRQPAVTPPGPRVKPTGAVPLTVGPPRSAAAAPAEALRIFRPISRPLPAPKSGVARDRA
jgi:hypothetical protein